MSQVKLEHSSEMKIERVTKDFSLVTCAGTQRCTSYTTGKRNCPPFVFVVSPTTQSSVHGTKLARTRGPSTA